MQRRKAGRVPIRAACSTHTARWDWQRAQPLPQTQHHVITHSNGTLSERAAAFLPRQQRHDGFNLHVRNGAGKYLVGEEGDRVVLLVDRALRVCGNEETSRGQEEERERKRGSVRHGELPPQPTRLEHDEAFS
eukprot:2102707-Rhodomonas_salina.2